MRSLTGGALGRLLIGGVGIWTKHVKVKTELHQTIIDRCLKSLTQKKLVKCISGSVQVRLPFSLPHMQGFTPKPAPDA